MNNNRNVICDRHEGEGNARRVLVEKLVGKRLIGKRSLDEYNIKVNLRDGM
jgi:hypothetical protein